MKSTANHNWHLTKYDANNAYIASINDHIYKHYYIHNNKYYIYYSLDGSISVNNLNYKKIFSANIGFDLTKFAKIKDDSIHPHDFELLYSSAIMINDQVDRLLNLMIYK